MLSLCLNNSRLIMTDNLKTQVLEKANLWLNSNIDSNSKNEIKELISNNETELTEAFYKDLEFGTGGMRGIMSVGPNRMNKYTVGMATQGLANYLNKQFKNTKKSAAIAYDCRNNSEYFARTAAEILSANGVEVYLFDALRPTPELSFAIRELKCQCGIVVTASHNPKEYNGYKVYWEDGGQIIAPHDQGIISEVRAISSPDAVSFTANSENIHIIGKEIDKLYIDKVCKLSLSPELVKAASNMAIVYTPIHGTGVKLVPQALKAFGFNNIINVPEQDINDGNFPTVVSPNPEEPAALEMAINKAKSVNADIVMGTDPDADRVGIVVRKNSGEYQLLNGNQTATILIYYLLTRWQETGKLKGKEYIVKTIVTTELLKEIANSYNVESFDTLTGFKFIAAKIREQEGNKQFIVGGEESYGYLAGEFVRDKDAVIACSLIAEAAAWAKSQNKTLWDILLEIYSKYSCYQERLISIKKEGKSGAEEIKEMMEKFRHQSPENINGQQVQIVNDFNSKKSTNKISNLTSDLDFPKSNVLQYILEDGSKISIRPSGTEPKIKFYFSVNTKMENPSAYASTKIMLENKIDVIIKDLNIS
jgi:phosphoglucomutase